MRSKTYPKIYTARSFAKSAIDENTGSKTFSFDSSQLDSSFTCGVLPVLITPTERLPDSILAQLTDYLIEKIPSLSHKLFPLTAQVSSIKVSDTLEQWITDSALAFENISRLNEKLHNSGIKVNAVCVKPSALLDYSDETKRRWNPLQHDLLSCNLSSNAYSLKFAAAKSALGEIAKTAASHDLLLMLENDQPTYFVSRSDNSAVLNDSFLVALGVPEEDPRLGKSYFPWHLQCLSLGHSANSLRLLLADVPNTVLMFDAEHWKMTENYYKYQSAELPRLNGNLEWCEEQFVRRFGYLVSSNMPLIFKKKIDLSEEIKDIPKLVYGMHISGFGKNPIVVNDAGKKLIGETWPLIFDSETMSSVKKYAKETNQDFDFADLSYAIKDELSREAHCRDIYSNALMLAKNIRSETRLLVLEQKIRPGLYSGPEYEKFLRTSKVCLEYVLSENGR